MSDWVIEPRSVAGYRLNDPLRLWDSLTVVERYLKPGSWQVVGPVKQLAPLMAPGMGVVLSRSGDQRMSGQVTDYSWDATGNATVNGYDDKIWLGGGPEDNNGIFVGTNPALPISQQVQGSLTFVGIREDVINNLVFNHIGPGAFLARRVGRLGGFPSLHRGGSVSRTVKTEPLHLLLQEFAEAGGLTYDMTHAETSSGPRLLFAVGTVSDVSATVRFGPASQGGPGVLGDDWSLKVSAPSMTDAIVGGTSPPPQVFGDGASDASTPGVDLRLYREVQNAGAVTAWGRYIEGFVDSSNSNTAAELDQAGTQALSVAGERREFSGTLTDSDQIRYGRDWLVGYKVGVTVAGVEFADIVREVVTKVQAQQGQQTESLQAAVGWSQVSTLTTKSVRAQQSTMRQAARIALWK